jgi:hypothetical protein
MSIKSTIFWNSDPDTAILLQNIGIELPDYIALHPKKLLSYLNKNDTGDIQAFK